MTSATIGHGTILKVGDSGAGAAVKASRSIGSSNAQYRVLAATAGAAGNSLLHETIVSGNNTALSVTVTSSRLTITSETDGSGNPVSTVNDIIAKCYQTTDFDTYFDIDDNAGDGTGTIAGASALASLASGSDGGEVFTAVAEVKNVGAITRSRDIIDATHLSSTLKEGLAGLETISDVTFTLQLIPASGGQHRSLQADYVAKTIRNWQVLLPNAAGNRLDLAGFLSQWSIEPGSTDSVIMVSAAIHLTALPVWGV